MNKCKFFEFIIKIFAAASWNIILNVVLSYKFFRALISFGLIIFDNWALFELNFLFLLFLQQFFLISLIQPMNLFMNDTWMVKQMVCKIAPSLITLPLIILYHLFRYNITFELRKLFENFQYSFNIWLIIHAFFLFKIFFNVLILTLECPFHGIIKRICILNLFLIKYAIITEFECLNRVLFEVIH